VQAKKFSDVDIQSDTYHAVAHKLGLWHTRLGRYAEKSIEEEYKKEELLLNSKSEKTCKKRELEYHQCREKSIKAIKRFDDFEFIYHNLLSCFTLFDPNGELKDKGQAMDKFNAALELGIESIEYEGIKTRLKSISKIKHRLFHFYDIAQGIVQGLEKQTDKFTLNLICLYWQTRKRWIKTKNSKVKRKIKEYENSLLADIEELVGDRHMAIIEGVTEKLNAIVQSSSAVECINSILRPYLNSSKNQSTQEFLNLFMFYHNHRRFNAGQRKGCTPMELFTGKEQTADWLEIMLDKLKKKLGIE
jgi:hypothetical protein